MIEAWRLLREKDGLPVTLFHGWRGSRKLPLDENIRAEIKMVHNPGKKAGLGYLSGWHVSLSREGIDRYRKTRFKRPDELVVCRCFVDDIRPKPRCSSQIMLADLLMIKSSDWLAARVLG